MESRTGLSAAVAMEMAVFGIRLSLASLSMDVQPAPGLKDEASCRIIRLLTWSAFTANCPSDGLPRTSAFGGRIHRAAREQAGRSEAVELRVQPGVITIRPAAGPRAGWSEAAKLMRARGDDRLLDPPTPQRFGEEERTW